MRSRNLHDPFRSLAERFRHLVDHDGEEVEKLVVDTFSQLSLSYDVLSQKVGGVAPFLAVLDVSAQCSLVGQVEVATELHAHLRDLGSTFSAGVEDSGMFEVGDIVVHHRVPPLADLSSSVALPSLRHVASEKVDGEGEEGDDEQEDAKSRH